MGVSTCWMKQSRSLEQMKMGALGTGRAERILARMGSGADGQEWEDRAMMVPLNGKRLYVFGSLLILTVHIPVLRAIAFATCLLIGSAILPRLRRAYGKGTGGRGLIPWRRRGAIVEG